MSLLKQLNEEYLALHQSKEEEFWKCKMGHASYENGQFEEKELKFKAWISNPQYLPQIRASLDDSSLEPQVEQGLKGWLHFFEVNAIEDPDALAIQKELIQAEGQLEAKRAKMTLGYKDPKTEKFVKSSYGDLSLTMVTAKEEAMRQAAWEGLAEIGPFVLENGFLEIVQLRNKLAHKLGYEDYYDYKVQLNEGFSKKQLFQILDDLSERTEAACQQSVDDVVAEHGELARQGWNFRFLTAGDLTAERDPYFTFDTAFERWAESFSAMNIQYNNATIQLDLLERQGKYHNGFMHGTFPGFRDNGEFRPAHINFTANAIPNKVGSGINALTTLFHEGGHAAHFSNIDRPAPCFSQEFAPSSVAFAETQSMFLDSLIDDSDWQYKYAKNKDGERIPQELINKGLSNVHKFRAQRLRYMLTVSYVEKGIYEMTDDALTAENILAMAQWWEQKMQCMETVSRPTMCIPHIISGEASAYYHGYTLAEMAVYQTKDYFFKKYGYIVDNPEVGKELAKVYWECGNEKDFLTLVEELTGEPFTARATGELINQSEEDVIAGGLKAIETLNEKSANGEAPQLGGTFKLVDGDQLIASSQYSNIKQMSQAFKEYVGQRFPSN